MPFGGKHLFLIQRKRFSGGNDWRGEHSRCSVKVLACEQVLPTVIQMAAPEHRQWGLHRYTPWGQRSWQRTHTHWIFFLIYMHWWGVAGSVGERTRALFVMAQCVVSHV